MLSNRDEKGRSRWDILNEAAQSDPEAEKKAQSLIEEHSQLCLSRLPGDNHCDCGQQWA